MAKQKDIRQFRRSNKAQILWYLYNRGPLSRLELAKLCKLTTPSITQLINDLLVQNEVKEIGSIQRNSTGRREVLLDLNPQKNIALGINVEADVTYFCVANVKEVFNVEKEDTSTFRFDDTMDVFDGKIAELLEKYPSINKICIGLSGKVIDGFIENAYAKMLKDFDMKNYIEQKFGIETEVINSTKAQALAMYRETNENYLFVTHSPEISSAMVLKGELLKGKNNVTGELGHTVIEVDGKPCKCGKRGCLNTYVSDEAIEQEYFERTGNKKTIDEIYNLYGIEEEATAILKKVIRTIAVLLANVYEILNPNRIFVSGGIFAEDKVYSYGWEILNKCGFTLEVERITDTEGLKSTAEARYIILKSILNV